MEIFNGFQIDSDLSWFRALSKSWQNIFMDEIPERYMIEHDNWYEIGDVAATKMKQITKLTIYDNDIDSLEPLKYLNQLEELDCGRTDIGSLEPLRGLSKLNKLVYPPSVKIEEFKRNSDILCILYEEY